MKIKRRVSLSRIFCLILTVFFLISSLSGCIWFRPLRLPQLREFERTVLKKYPFSKVSCEYDYGAWVDITVERLEIDEECAYTVLSYLQPIVSDEEFIQDLFELFEEESNGDPNWKSGMRPDINLNLIAMGETCYRFQTSAYKERYNSGQSPDSYTWEGYTVWYGTEMGDHLSREITPEEIESAVERYSQAP